MGESMWDSFGLGAGGSSEGGWGSMFLTGGAESAQPAASADGWGWDDLGKAATSTLSDLARGWADYNFSTSPDVIRAKQIGEGVYGNGYYQPGTRQALSQGGGLSISSDVLILGGIALAAVLMLRG